MVSTLRSHIERHGMQTENLPDRKQKIEDRVKAQEKQHGVTAQEKAHRVKAQRKKQDMTNKQASRRRPDTHMTLHDVNCRLRHTEISVT